MPEKNGCFFRLTISPTDRINQPINIENNEELCRYIQYFISTKNVEVLNAINKRSYDFNTNNTNYPKYPLLVEVNIRTFSFTHNFTRFVVNFYVKRYYDDYNIKFSSNLVTNYNTHIVRPVLEEIFQDESIIPKKVKLRLADSSRIKFP